LPNPHRPLLPVSSSYDSFGMIRLEKSKPWLPAIRTLLLLAASLSTLQAAPFIFPAPRESQPSGAHFVLDNAVTIAIPAEPSDDDLFLARLATAEFSDQHHLALVTRRLSSVPAEGRFLVMGSMRSPLVRQVCDRLHIPSVPAEGYVIDVGDRIVLVAGSDDAGALYGFESLRQLADQRDIQGTRIRDWPYKSFRGIKMYVPGRDNIPYFKRFVRDFMALYKYNKLILEMNAVMRLDRHPELNEGWIAIGKDLADTRRDRAWGPGRQLQDSANADAGDGGVLEKEEVAELVRYASQFHIEVIPEIPTLTHSYYLLTRHRELAEISQAEWPDTYCPSEPKVYDLVFDVLDEYIDVMRPRMVHIGHDEWRMPVGVCPRCKGKSYTELYAQDINRIYAHLKGRGIRTAIWGDHLVEPLRGEQIQHVPNRGGEAYDTPGALSPAQVKNLIPTDILVFNWFWDENEKGEGEPNEVALRQWGFEQVYGNFQPNIRDYDRRTAPSPMIGGAPSSWAATNEFNFGKDLMFDFLGCAELLWSTHRSMLPDLSRTVQILMPDVRRHLAAAPLPGESNPVRTVFTSPEPVLVSSGKTAVHESAAIPVGEDASSVVFVHASLKPARNRPAYEATWNYVDTADLLGWYEITYDDDFVATVPVRYAVNILEQGWSLGHDPRNVAYEAALVESGNSDSAFFAYEWVSPRFGKRIREIRLKAASPAQENGILLHAVKVVPRRSSSQR